MLTSCHSYDGLKKTDLEAALDEHMRANQSTLAKDSKFDDFFRRIQGPTSPVKREGAGTVTVSNEVKKPRQRRVTKAREEAEPTYVLPFTDILLNVVYFALLELL